jgi:hypothetical protein
VVLQNVTRILLVLALVGLSLVAVACEDDPFALSWENLPDTAMIYSRARPELYLPTGYNFVSRSPVLIESPTFSTRWDLILDTVEGEMVFLPPRTFGVVSTAGIAPLGAVVFEEVGQAPSDTTDYVRDQPVPVVEGHVYVIRTHQEPNNFGQLCVFYAKMEPLVADVDAGTLEFLIDTNPICNDRTLIAPGN